MSRIPVMTMALTALLATLGAVRPAAATSDCKNYPGNMCQVVATGWTTSDIKYYDATSGSSYTAGTSANHTTSGKVFICPVVADCATNYGGGNWVAVIDYNGDSDGGGPDVDENVQCSISIRDAISGSGSWGTADATSGRNSNVPIKVTPTPVTTTYTDPYKFVTCYVPGYDTASYLSGVVAYSIDENC